MIDNHQKNVKHENGLTLIELVLVIAILSIMALMAAPSFSDFFTRSQLRTDYLGLEKDIKYAREMAKLQGKPVGIVIKDNDANDWKKGYVVWQDTNNNGRLNRNETILKEQDNLAISASLHLKSDVNSEFKTILFDTNGMIDTSAELALSICPQRFTDSIEGRQLTLLPSGLVVLTDASLDCSGA